MKRVIFSSLHVVVGLVEAVRHANCEVPRAPVLKLMYGWGRGGITCSG